MMIISIIMSILIFIVSFIIIMILSSFFFRHGDNYSMIAVVGTMFEDYHHDDHDHDHDNDHDQDHEYNSDQDDCQDHNQITILAINMTIDYDNFYHCRDDNDHGHFLHDNYLQTWCKLLHIMTTYLMLTTYSWMLCEGTYLKVILVRLQLL